MSIILADDPKAEKEKLDRLQEQAYKANRRKQLVNELAELD